ncbi:hypothetical protein GCM10010349_56570 [Streptomyces flavofungini]|nr:hypothetical protein GCM10010349_56570 [Streptomyces flavofungini]
MEAAFGAARSGVHRSFAQPVDNFSDASIPVDNRLPKSRFPQGDRVKAAADICPVSGIRVRFIDPQDARRSPATLATSARHSQEFPFRQNGHIALEVNIKSWAGTGRR